MRAIRGSLLALAAVQTLRASSEAAADSDLKVNIEGLTAPDCPFIRGSYRCSHPETVIWRSCCATGTCLTSCGCGSGRLPAESVTLFYGNSHIRQIAEALVCQNLEELKTVSFAQYNLTAARPRKEEQEQFGEPEAAAAFATTSPCLALVPPEEGVAVTLLPCPQRHWTFDSPSGEVLDESLRPVDKTLVALDDAEMKLYTFANGARVITALNHPATMTPRADEKERFGWEPHGLSLVMSLVNVSAAELTGVVMNEGNDRRWAAKYWGCGPSRTHEDELVPSEKPGYPGIEPKWYVEICRRLTSSLHECSRLRSQLVVDTAYLMGQLAEQGFGRRTGGRVVLTTLFTPQSQPPPPLSVGMQQHMTNQSFRVCALPPDAPVHAADDANEGRGLAAREWAASLSKKSELNGMGAAEEPALRFRGARRRQRVRRLANDANAREPRSESRSESTTSSQETVGAATPVRRRAVAVAVTAVPVVSRWPFEVLYYDLAAVVRDNECTAPSCEQEGLPRHQCLPGPPDDAWKAIVQQLYD